MAAVLPLPTAVMSNAVHLGPRMDKAEKAPKVLWREDVWEIDQHRIRG